MSTKPLSALFTDLPNVHIVDVGASLLDENPPYQDLILRGGATLLAFEPAPKQLERLRSGGMPRASYRSEAIGTGEEQTLHQCVAPGMTSLFEPNDNVLKHFHGFSHWGTVESTVSLETHRLDDIPEAEGMDYLKIDIQGGELGAFQGAGNLLSQTLVVQTEAQLVPFYKDQPLFADIDLELRKSGLLFHRFIDMTSRVFLPMLVNNDPLAGMSQQLWADAVYVRDFTTFESMDPESLMKLATILHDIYQSWDMVGLALTEVDQREGGNRHGQYIEWVAPQLA